MLLADRIRRHIDVMGPFPAAWFDMELDTYVDPPHDVGRCFVWRGKRDEKGYGRFRVDDREMQAHRVVWKATGHTVDRGEHLDHRCRNTWCVNPRHLERVDAAENSRRARIAKRCRLITQAYPSRRKSLPASAPFRSPRPGTRQ